jgi:hypothetical protein
VKNRPLPAPGQVWWCEGSSLQFEAHFKTRPVLLVDEAEGNELWLVMPLSSRRRFGQELRVIHGNKTSYMTGKQAIVTTMALVSYSGDWADFDDWRNPPPPSTFSLWQWLRNLFRRH